jgi:hypothetical protein
MTSISEHIKHTLDQIERFALMISGNISIDRDPITATAQLGYNLGRYTIIIGLPLYGELYRIALDAVYSGDYMPLLARVAALRTALPAITPGLPTDTSILANNALKQISNIQILGFTTPLLSLELGCSLGYYAETAGVDGRVLWKQLEQCVIAREYDPLVDAMNSMKL